MTAHRWSEPRTSPPARRVVTETTVTAGTRPAANVRLRTDTEHAMHPIEIDHVTKRYGSNTVLHDLSFRVEPGRVTGFLGPNGAGKSTLMKILLDLAAQRVRAYSLGMRQRLGIAAALLGDPPVLVLDEPGNGLDPQGIRWLRDLLRLRAANGNTVFVSSHLLAEVEHLADEVVVINHGRLVAAGPIAELQQAATTVRAASPERLANVLTTAGAAVVPHDGALEVRGLPIERIGELAFSAGVALHELAPRTGSLEGLFLDWTHDEQPAGDGRAEVTTR